MNEVSRKLFAVLTLIVMLFVSYIIGNRLMTYLLELDTSTQWIMFAALAIVILVGTFGVPILIATTNMDINPFNAIFAFVYLMFITPYITLFTGFVWDLAIQQLPPATMMDGGMPLLIIQMVILVIVIGFAYILPLSIMISEESLPTTLLGGG